MYNMYEEMNKIVGSESLLRMMSSEMLRRVAVVRTDVS
jgi:hypothetical protein